MLWLVTSHVEPKTTSRFECFATERALNMHVFYVVRLHMIFNVGRKLGRLSTLHTLPNRGVVHIKGFGHERLNQSLNVCSQIWLGFD